jgi:membrane-associated protein
VAGMGKMKYARFLSYNITGGIAWVLIFTYAGYFFGELEFVKKNLTVLVLAIIFISILPAVFEVWRNKRKKNEKYQKQGNL